MQQLNLENAPGHPQVLYSDYKKIVVMSLPLNVNVIQAGKLHFIKSLLKRIVASENADTSAEPKKVNLKDV